MNTHNCIPSTDLTEAEVTPAQWNQTELLQRAGGLVREALASQPTHVWRMHREDMLQTAVVAFLEQADQPAGYAYATVRGTLKNYRWVHIRGLNGGWKSLACIKHGYSVMNFADVLPETADEPLDGPQTAAETLSARQWENVPRPVEWAVLRRQAAPGQTQAEILREVLYILAGMSGNFYPEQLYRAALIITLLGRDYTWEHVEERTGLSFAEVYDIYWGWRKRYLNPYLQFSPLHQEMIKLRGRMRITFFEELDPAFLNTAVRKMVVFPHGIYTIIYKQRSRSAGRRAGQVEASLQKMRQVNGQKLLRAMHLGPVGDLTKERLYEASFAVERKLAALSA
ncbi:MAG: hypothetical protein H6657_20890 [Ardenticatenaceae bacterium]|nr:hypothetical protein [Ardenticatenaceae bacterium]